LTIILSGNGGARTIEPVTQEGLLGALVGGAVGFVTGGIPGAVAGAVAGASGGEPAQGSQPIPGGDLGQIPGQSSGLAAPTQCPPDRIRVGNQCVKPGAALPGGEPLTVPAGGNGKAMGPIGMSGGTPMTSSQETRRCGRGNVLGRDGLCYDRRVIRNSDRMWPKGRKPLLTGGELNAISTAARAAGRVKRTQKKLEKLGLLKKPTRRPSSGSSKPVPMRQGSDGVYFVDQG
jgi:hypothetical protein